MTNKLSPEQYQALEEFVNELWTCFDNYQRTRSKIEVSGKFVDILMDYVKQALIIHKELAQLKVNRYVNDMAEDFNVR